MHLSTEFFESWNPIRGPFKIGALYLAFFGNICQIPPHRFLIHFKHKSHSPYLQSTICHRLVRLVKVEQLQCKHSNAYRK